MQILIDDYPGTISNMFSLVSIFFYRHFSLTIQLQFGKMWNNNCFAINNDSHATYNNLKRQFKILHSHKYFKQNSMIKNFMRNTLKTHLS